MNSMTTDSEINRDEMRAIANAITALRAVVKVHGQHQEHYDSVWMEVLDEMITNLRYRDGDCLRLQRHLGGACTTIE
jgi:hypothetical protein